VRTGTRAQHGFCGQLGHTAEDGTGGLIYMRARYYDPAIGRFVSEDQKQSGNNRYAYAGNSPTNAVDATGENIVVVALIALAIAIAVVGGLSSCAFTGKWNRDQFAEGALYALIAAGCAYLCGTDFAGIVLAATLATLAVGGIEQFVYESPADEALATGLGAGIAAATGNAVAAHYGYQVACAILIGLIDSGKEAIKYAEGKQ
jgi:RHS repeat-associated protein